MIVVEVSSWTSLESPGNLWDTTLKCLFQFIIHKYPMIRRLHKITLKSVVK